MGISLKKKPFCTFLDVLGFSSMMLNAVEPKANEELVARLYDAIKGSERLRLKEKFGNVFWSDKAFS